MYSVWVVERQSHTSLRFVQNYHDPESGLLSASRILRGIGARGVKARNVTWGTHVHALLVEDIACLLPVSVVVTGATIEDGGVPIEDEVVGMFEDDREAVVYN